MKTIYIIDESKDIYNTLIHQFNNEYFVKQGDKYQSGYDLYIVSSKYENDVFNEQSIVVVDKASIQKNNQNTFFLTKDKLVYMPYIISKIFKKHHEEKEISMLLKTLGMPVHLKGFHYIKEAIIYMQRHRFLQLKMTSDIYPYIALLYKTTPQRVERAMRHAISVTWKKGGKQNFYKRFGYLPLRKPTNSELLATLLDELTTRY